MIALEILLWLGIILAIVGTVLALKYDADYLAFLALGGMIILLVWVVALYDFGQLPPSVDWFRRLLIDSVERR